MKWTGLSAGRFDRTGRRVVSVRLLVIKRGSVAHIILYIRVTSGYSSEVEFVFRALLTVGRSSYQR